MKAIYGWIIIFLGILLNSSILWTEISAIKVLTFFLSMSIIFLGMGIITEND